MFIFTFLLTFLILSRGKIRRSNDILGNDGDQFPTVSQETYQLSNYDITFWIRPLQVEYYAFLENRESFYTVFVELNDSPFIIKIIDSYYVIKLFFELYNCSILNFENLCSLELRKFRKSNCIFTEGTTYTTKTNLEGHQKWCNITLLNIKTPVFNYCMIIADDQRLQRPEEFPLYFNDLLLKSFRIPGNVHKIVRCFIIMINGIRTTRCDVNCHRKQLFCKDIGLWTFMMPVVTSNSFFRLPPNYNNTCGKGLVLIVSLCYNQITEKNTINYIDPGLFYCPISFMKYICKLASNNNVTTIVRFTEYLPIDDYIQKNICIYIFEEELSDHNQKSNEVYYNNDFKEILLVTPKYIKSMKSLRRHLLQNIDHGYGYGNMDYSAQGDKFAYQGYARHKDSIMNENKDENDDDDDDDDDDEEDEDYEISDEPAPEDENDNAEEEEEDDEFGHQSIGPKAHLGSFNRVIFPYVSKKQKQHLRKENIRVRSVTVTEECDEEEPTEALQYYDYDTNGVDISFGNIHNTQIDHFIKLIIINLILLFINF
ncbi:DNA polymerase epsilon subunit 2-like isoform X2 [Vespa mandarinia]|uniref:DNA polymerase epsilon subunit 2-like isoform X2 n=1 Tax=Vespa mandarinia TaxID=7446 RepID=UPI00160DFC89|nr:DNA polymerase epsilon subunit 2-like isoform X2 [Vespa mandarinia]